MANIMINKVCNLSCSYCFANDYVNVPSESFHHSKNMTVGDFKKAVDFAIRAGHTRIGIIGGEPTVHPQFKEIMRIARSARQPVVLFTNGVFIDKHIEVLRGPQVGMLINCNPPEIMGERQFSRMRENILRFIREGIKQPAQPRHVRVLNERGMVTIGLNMHKPDFEYAHILDLVRETGIRAVRTSIAVPNTVDKFGNPSKDYFYQIKPRMFEFFRALKELGAVPHFDCNNIPLCTLTPEEYDFLEDFNYFDPKGDAECGSCSGGDRSGDLVNEYNIELIGHITDALPSDDPRKALLKQQAERYVARTRADRSQRGQMLVRATNLTDGAQCRPIIDILPDLTAIRCFGLSNDFTTHIDDFQHEPRGIHDYYVQKFDSLAYSIPTYEDCKTCPAMVKRKCMGGCLAFKTTQFAKVWGALGEDPGLIGKGQSGQSAAAFVHEDQLKILAEVEEVRAK